jgi:hypothetical protein
MSIQGFAETQVFFRRSSMGIAKQFLLLAPLEDYFGYHASSIG